MAIAIIAIIIFVIAMGFFASDADPAAKKSVSPQGKSSIPGFCDGQAMCFSPEFAKSQLIGGERFLSTYAIQLADLRRNPGFMGFIRRLSRELAEPEQFNTREANKKIAVAFFENRVNEKYPEVADIVSQVRRYGKQASAHISIYYAMFIVE